MNEIQAAELDRLKRYYRRHGSVEEYHEDDLGAWVRVTDRSGEDLATHLISPSGETSAPGRFGVRALTTLPSIGPRAAT